MGRNERGSTSWGGIVLIVIGVVFLLNNFDFIRVRDLVRFWPLLLIAIGARLLLDSRQRSTRQTEASDTGNPAPPPPPASS